MSRFQQKNKALVSLSVCDSKDVWIREKGKYKLNPKLDIYGKVDKSVSSCIMTTNSKGENHKFVDDFHNLPKNCKNKVVDMFMNRNKKVVYLIKNKNKK